MIEITLNPVEEALCRDIAKRRYNSNRSNGVADKKIGPQDTQETDENGIGGEVAVAKFLNLYPDMVIKPQSKTYDLMSRKGSRIDVKTTKYKNGRMLATLKKHVEDCDVYVLVTGVLPKYKIVGWIKSEDLIKDENVVDLGHGHSYGVTQDRLHPLGNK
jgi:hypothetical protein